MKKRILTFFLACALLVASLAGMTACSLKPPPPLEEVYDRLVEVIEDSHEVNVLLFGAGLPVYPRGDAEDALIHRYYGKPDNGQEFVTPYAKFQSVDAMKAAIEAVYGREYRESLFASLFTGYADTGMSMTMPARFSEDENALYQNMYVDALIHGMRVYDYAGMEIAEGSHSTYLRVSIPSYTEDHPGEWVRVFVSFVYENGDWYLDSPSC